MRAVEVALLSVPPKAIVLVPEAAMTRLLVSKTSPVKLILPLLLIVLPKVMSKLVTAMPPLPTVIAPSVADATSPMVKLLRG